MEHARVLVVDDAAFIRDLVRKTLLAKFPGMQVEDAINGRTAQQLLKTNAYDLILCDWEMPEMSGIELLQWIRQQHRSTVPFVMVTSRGDKANVIQAIQAGVSDYIGKPFSSEALQAKVIKVLSKPLAAPPPASDSTVNALTGSGPARQPSPPRSPQPTSLVSKPAAKPAAVKSNTPAARVAQLRFGEHVNQCLIKTLSLKQLVLVCKVDEGLPALFEAVVIDLEQHAGTHSEVARINAMVRGLKANDSGIDCQHVSVTIDIVDQDPGKLSYLSRMIASGTVQQSYVPGA
ncbi:MAG: DNA-binding response OmpR family regulator [Motiliproteus sp.]|jgi:DNA-binding response OmpR family regulator